MSLAAAKTGKKRKRTGGRKVWDEKDFGFGDFGNFFFVFVGVLSFLEFCVVRLLCPFCFSGGKTSCVVSVGFHSGLIPLHLLVTQSHHF